MSSRTVAALLPAVWLSAALYGAEPGEWSVGTSLPDLSTCKLEGDLPALTGKVVLIDFWASWCAPCKKSFPALDELQKKHADNGLVILAVSVDDKPEPMQRFLDKRTVSFAVVRDAGQELVAQAGISAMPSSFIVDRGGTIRFCHLGFHGEKTVREYTDEIESLLGEEDR